MVASPSMEAPATDSSASLRDESALVALLKAGDEAAFERLVRTHAGRLLAVARRFLRNEEDARDAVQEAFLSAFRSLNRFAGDSRISTWLHRIVVNKALMKLRSRKRKPEESIEDLLPRFLEDGHQVHESVPWNETDVERRETKELVRRAIDRLPDTYRTIILLRDIEGYDTEETAKLLQVTANAVKIRLHRARQALRSLLDPHLGGAAA
ncbi:MAG: sigma-70 family RNA polymerase sigma factor [Acidobacteriota bacterium]